VPNKFHDAMNSLAADIANEPSWRIYADWCKARANDLRDQSAVAAEQFVEVAQGWSFEERKRFGLWLMDSSGRVLEHFTIRLTISGVG